MAELTEGLNLSTRQLEGLFFSEVGVNAKTLSTGSARQGIRADQCDGGCGLLRWFGG